MTNLENPTELAKANGKEATSIGDPEAAHPPKRSIQFWGVFVAIAVALFTAALDLTAVSTALPTIVNDLHGSQFVWVGSAYALSATAFLPMSGGLAQVSRTLSFSSFSQLLILIRILVIGVR
jgi:MFS family permease